MWIFIYAFWAILWPVPIEFPSPCRKGGISNLKISSKEKELEGSSWVCSGFHLFFPFLIWVPFLHLCFLLSLTYFHLLLLLSLFIGHWPLEPKKLALLALYHYEDELIQCWNLCSFALQLLLPYFKNLSNSLSSQDLQICFCLAWENPQLLLGMGKPSCYGFGCEGSFQ